MSVIGTGGFARKSIFFFNILTCIFAYIPDFTIFPFVEQTKNLSFG